MACEVDMGVKYCDLDALLAESDVVSIHTPLNTDTRHMIDKYALAKMRKGSFFSTARDSINNVTWLKP
jgi:phosphoglycerate dehydrogenase-like enzyme